MALEHQSRKVGALLFAESTTREIGQPTLIYRFCTLNTTSKYFARNRAKYRFTRSASSSLTSVLMVTMAPASRPLKQCPEAISIPLSSPHSSKLFIAGTAPSWSSLSRQRAPQHRRVRQGRRVHQQHRVLLGHVQAWPQGHLSLDEP